MTTGCIHNAKYERDDGDEYERDDGDGDGENKGRAAERERIEHFPPLSAGGEPLHGRVMDFK